MCLRASRSLRAWRQGNLDFLRFRGFGVERVGPWVVDWVGLFPDGGLSGYRIRSGCESLGRTSLLQEPNTKLETQTFPC